MKYVLITILSLPFIVVGQTVNDSILKAFTGKNVAGFRLDSHGVIVGEVYWDSTTL
jgi:hypothetical protein